LDEKMVFPMKDNTPHYVVPDSLETALQCHSDEKGAAYLAGGTDLMPLIRTGIRRPVSLIDLEAFDPLKGIENREDGIFVGAMTELAELVENETITRRLPALASAARHVASPQIRNMATLGGNLFQEKRCIYFNQSEFWRQNVDPCYRLEGHGCYQIPKAGHCMAIYYSDLAPLLMAYEARALVFDGNSRETLPMEELVHRHCQGLLGSILLEGVIVPHANDGSSGVFVKYGIRQAIDFAFSNAGIRFTPALERGKAATLKIYLGAVGPEPVRLVETEKAVLKALDAPALTKTAFMPVPSKKGKPFQA
jgi:4-hydroxybenzoyl-CoA reductase subunit beta